MPSALTVLRPAGVALLLLAAVAVTAAVLYAYWPAGIAVGVAFGTGAVLAVGARMQVTERLQPVDADLAESLGITAAPRTTVAAPVAPKPVVAPVALEPVLHVQPDVLYFTSDDDPDVVEAREVVGAEAGRADPVRADLEQLKSALGDDYRDFARAARLVVSTQYASAARLQRDLDLPYSRARRLLADLEEQHFVGPATGSLPRQVLMPKDRLPEVELLLAEV
jgi:DNA segregation ATPase FtsK/SpoIIIE-like protein